MMSRKMQRLKKIGRALQWALTAALALLLICNVYIICAREIGGVKQPRVLGHSAVLVVSGSMSGSIEINDMVITRSAKSYEPGDVILFESGSSLVTHRIVEIQDGEYVTRGDANNAIDVDTVAYDEVIGKVVYVIPGAGKAIGFLKSPLGMCGLCLIAAAMLLLPTELYSLSRRTRGEEDEKAVPQWEERDK